MDVTLITGVNGLIGHAVAERLARANSAVVGMDRVLPTNSELVNLGVTLIEGDLRDAHRMYAVMRDHGVTRILHAGGISGPMLVRDNPHHLFEINVTGTMHVAEAARVLGIKRLIFLSSYVTYGEQPDDSPVGEQRALAADNPYACSKIAGEAILRSYHEHHGLEAVSLRLGAVYGPRRTTTCLVRLILQNALNRVETRLDFGSDWARPFVYLDDIVEAISRALDAPFARVREHAYNVAGGVWPTITELAAVAGQVVPDVQVSLQSGRSPLDYRIGPLDLTAIARDLDFTPQVALADGIRRYLDWLKARQIS